MAKVTGFIKRKRKFSAFEFVLLMVVGQMSMVHPSLSGMVEAVRVNISRVALHLRFTAQAAEFLLACLKSYKAGGKCKTQKVAERSRKDLSS